MTDTIEGGEGWKEVTFKLQLVFLVTSCILEPSDTVRNRHMTKVTFQDVFSEQLGKMATDVVCLGGSARPLKLFHLLFLQPAKTEWSRRPGEPGINMT